MFTRTRKISALVACTVLIPLSVVVVFQLPEVSWIFSVLAWVGPRKRSIPDGYLGTIRTRRDDRGRDTSDNVLNALKVRVGQRSYQRGVHRGERIDVQDYYYPDGLDNMRGIRRQMEGVRDGNVIRVKRGVENAMAAPAPHLPNDGKANMRSTSPLSLDKRRVDQMARMRTPWR